MMMRPDAPRAAGRLEGHRGGSLPLKKRKFAPNYNWGDNSMTTAPLLEASADLTAEAGLLRTVTMSMNSLSRKAENPPLNSSWPVAKSLPLNLELASTASSHLTASPTTGFTLMDSALALRNSKHEPHPLNHPPPLDPPDPENQPPAGISAEEDPETPQGEEEEAERMAAWALLAAATSTQVPADRNEAVMAVAEDNLMTLDREESTSFVDDQPDITHRSRNRKHSSRTLHGIRPQQQTPEPPPTPILSSETAASKRNRSPLASPLPGGCHGRTSRNSSYCRRLPCYNGSPYCKLHYQHYIVAGGLRNSSSSGEDSLEEALEKALFTKASPAPPTGGQQCTSPTTPRAEPAQVPKAPSHTAKATSTGSVPPTPHQHHQDKRYMEGGTDLRCQATTTRGRPCAYVAVQESKYCYLHADYDTNPPPRRGRASGGGGAAAAGTSALATTKVGSSDHRVAQVRLPTLEENPTTPQVSDLSAAMVPSDASSTSSASLTRPVLSTKDKKASHNTKASSHHAVRKPQGAAVDTPHPILSMISTDHWLDQTVQIATGPFAHLLARVEKWGNGWVTVQIPGVGPHNRRAFELYLHPGDDPGEENGHSGSSSDSAMNDNKHAKTSSKLSAAQPPRKLSLQRRNEPRRGPDVEDSQRVFRCVSRDATSPLPSRPVVMVPSSHDVATSPAVPPSISEMSDSEDTARKMSLTPTSVSTWEATTGRAESRPEVDPNKTPVGAREVMPGLPTVTPLSAKKIRSGTDIPLMESLLIAADGSRKSHLDLLFGTAALERSRRTIHKPTRYEDQAMLVQPPPKKKGRRISLDDGTTGHTDDHHSREEASN